MPRLSASQFFEGIDPALSCDRFQLADCFHKSLVFRSLSILSKRMADRQDIAQELGQVLEIEIVWPV